MRASKPLVFNDERAINLKLLCLPGQAMWVAPQYEKYYSVVYKLWRDVVIEGLHSEGLFEAAARLSSDGFCSQQEIHCLFHLDTPVGMFAYRWLDLRFKASIDQSCIKENYPVEIIDLLQSETEVPVMTMGQMMVHPDWRRVKIGACVTELLAGFAVKRFLESPAEIAISYSRNNRSTHTLCYRYGARPLIKNHVSHGIASDIFAFYRNEICDSPVEGVQTVVNRLYSQRIEASLIPSFVDKKKAIPSII